MAGFVKFRSSSILIQEEINDIFIEKAASSGNGFF
jgi:hypothetical protein